MNAGSIFALSFLFLATPAYPEDRIMVPQIPPRPALGEMSFFVTSVGLGDGANLGGLTGADNHCQKLAKASGKAGAENRTWRAFLSTQATKAEPAINARDRIGEGPW